MTTRKSIRRQASPARAKRAALASKSRPPADNDELDFEAELKRSHAFAQMVAAWEKNSKSKDGKAVLIASFKPGDPVAARGGANLPRAEPPWMFAPGLTCPPPRPNQKLLRFIAQLLKSQSPKRANFRDQRP